MQKRLYITSILLPFLLGNIVFASTPPQIECSYSGKFNECYNANLAGTARSIEDFVCLDRAGNWQEVLTQIVLDEKFGEIDEEIEDYITQLEESKCEYFWPGASESFLKAVDDIEKNFPKYGYYWNKYKDLCEKGILEEVAECGDGIVNLEAANYLWGSERTACFNLVEVKLVQARQVSYNLLKLNKSQCRQDEHKKYVQQEREKYNWVLDLVRDILWYLERMVNGWVTKTRNSK